MNITGYVTLNEYQHKKGKLYGQERLFDTKDDFIGNFSSYDIDNYPNILVDKWNEIISMHPDQLKVEIEYSPIYEAI